MNRLHPTRNRRAIVTITMGDAYERMAKITHPLIETYTARCRADFVVLRQPTLAETLGVANYERFALYDLLLDYERIAFIDTDILVAPGAPCVFELTPEDEVGAASEETYSKAERDLQLTQEILGKVDWRNPYFNSGMMVVSRRHRELFDTSVAGLSTWATGEFRRDHVNLLNDQPYLNHRVNQLGFKVCDLGYRFNHTRCIPETHIRFRSHFIHYSGPSGHRYGTRLNQIRKDANVLTSHYNRALSQRWPAYRWVADRMDTAFVSYLLNEKLRGERSAA